MSGHLRGRATPRSTASPICPPGCGPFHFHHGLLGLLRYFDAVLGDGSGFPRKPAPDGIRFLVERAGTDVGDCLLVGDSVVDFETARNADCAIALARYGYGYERFPLQRLAGDEVLLDGPTELLHYLGL